MAKSLMSLAAEYETLSITGNCKNAGKTTVLNYLLDGYGKSGAAVAVTSVGLDGESVDAVTFTEKPRIYLYSGSLFATAFSLCSKGDVSAEILASTGIHTPLGEVVVFRAKSDGYAVIAGPPTSSGLALVSGLFRRFGAQRQLFDGAINRKSLAAPSVSDTTVFCAGASFSADIGDTVADAAFACELFSLEASGLDERMYGSGCFAVFDKNKKEIKNASVADISRGAAYAVFGGAVTDRELRPLVSCGDDLTGYVVTARDASRFFITRRTLDRLRAKGVVFSVLRPTALVAVAANPFSAYGAGYDSKEFVKRLSAVVSVPVFDVKGDAV